MVGPPTFFVGLMQASTFTRVRAASMRLVSSGGAGVTPAFVDEASEQLGCVVKRTYGSTEVPSVTTSYAGDPPERARTTDGRVVGDAQIRLAATSGELEVRGPEMFVGYVDEQQTREALTDDGWFRTGDLATIDDGWLTITGRLKDVVIRGGENIGTAEVEAVLEAHPSVRQAVVVGEPDDRLGERVVAFVVGSLDLDECRRWFAARGVAKFKWPERVVTVDALPVLTSGKPDRTTLRARLAARGS
jgi:cyclohexanecarboxylate-CoA ligase